MQLRNLISQYRITPNNMAKLLTSDEGALTKSNIFETLYYKIEEAGLFSMTVDFAKFVSELDMLPADDCPKELDIHCLLVSEEGGEDQGSTYEIVMQLKLLDDTEPVFLAVTGDYSSYSGICWDWAVATYCKPVEVVVTEYRFDNLFGEQA